MEVFTAGIYTWWPTDIFTIVGDELRDIVFEGQAGGQVYEVAADGSRQPWADVVVCEPPHRLVLAWNTGARRSVPTEVEVRFVAYEDGAGTRVELEHRFWERWEGGGTARVNYEPFWEDVLARFAGRAPAGG